MSEDPTSVIGQGLGYNARIPACQDFPLEDSYHLPGTKSVAFPVAVVSLKICILKFAFSFHQQCKFSLVLAYNGSPDASPCEARQNKRNLLRKC